MYQTCLDYLTKRGVELRDIADCVLYLQKDYHPNLTQQECIVVIQRILQKREVQQALLTGIALDIACDEGTIMDQELHQVIKDDSSLYGIDEVLAYGICNLYGSIALTNYGYIDKAKVGIIAKLNDDKQQCNTFLDDMIGAIAASASSKIAHNQSD